MITRAKELCLHSIKKERIANDTYSFYFDRTNIDLNFLPGQYVRMTLDIKNPDNRGNSRFFTIASSPLDRKYIMITTKIIQSSFKKTLTELVPGEKVKFFGPMGGFILNEKVKDHRVFLAGGVGMTPFHSMIVYAFSKNLSIPITLITSFSTAEEVFWYEKLKDITKKNHEIKVVYTVSHPKEFNVRWRGETGRISEGLIKKYVPNILEPIYYIVGPPAMVAAMEQIVWNMGIAQERIAIENFTGY